MVSDRAERSNRKPSGDVTSLDRALPSEFVSHHLRRSRPATLRKDDHRSCAMKTATDRAREAIVAAETMFAVEMGTALELGPAAKMALVVNITAAIRAAVAEERKRLAGPR